MRPNEDHPSFFFRACCAMDSWLKAAREQAAKLGTLADTFAASINITQDSL